MYRITTTWTDDNGLVCGRFTDDSAHRTEDAALADLAYIREQVARQITDDCCTYCALGPANAPVAYLVNPTVVDGETRAEFTVEWQITEDGR